MTTTIRDIVNGALYEIGVVEPEGTVEAIDAATGLSKLNYLMTGLRSQGIETLWDDLELNDGFPLGDEHREGVEAMLAVRLAAMPAYAANVSDGLRSIAIRGEQMLRTSYTIAEPMRAPSGSLNFPSQRKYY